MSITVGQLAIGASIGIGGGAIAYRATRTSGAESPGIGVASLLGGAASVTAALLLPTSAARVAVAGIGGGLLVGGSLGIRDAIEGARHTRLAPMVER